MEETTLMIIALGASPILSGSIDLSHLFQATPSTVNTQETDLFALNAYKTRCTTTSMSTAQETANKADEELMLAIAQGEEWAMEELYERYGRYAYALAYRIVRDATVAEDIVQDAFLSVWRKATSYQERQGSVRSWLQAIVHHRAIDRVRAATHRDHQWLPLQSEGEQDPPSEQPEVWEEAWHKEQCLAVRRVLTQLPPEQCQVIELAYFGGYTHVEIAERWQLPLGTVKGRMRLGLQKMRNLLREYGIETAG